MADPRSALYPCPVAVAAAKRDESLSPFDKSDSRAISGAEENDGRRGASGGNVSKTHTYVSSA